MRRHLPLVAVACLTALPAEAIDMPARKPGLWEMKMNFEGRNMPPQVMQQCIDAATDKLIQEKFNGQDICPKQEMSKSGNAIVVDSSCKIGNTATTTHAVFEGDFDSEYTVKVATALEGGIKKNMTMQAKWLGVCKPDQKPGDIEMPGGMKMNVLDMPKTPGAPQR